jgi:mRNA interferase YafQ
MTKFKLQFSNQFCKDYALMKKRWYDMKKLETVSNLLMNWWFIDEKYKDHQLKWRLKRFRDIHILPDWILLYQYIWKDIIVFERTWSHSDLF